MAVAVRVKGQDSKGVPLWGGVSLERYGMGKVVKLSQEVERERREGDNRSRLLRRAPSTGVLATWSYAVRAGHRGSGVGECYLLH